MIEQERWALVRLEQVNRRGLGPEIVKMEALLQRCKTEREEMQLISSTLYIVSSVTDSPGKAIEDQTGD